MKLLKLTLNNFKGIRSFTLDTRGGNVDVFADNELGKTTLFDAFLWLLFGKDSQNKADFEVKTLDENNQPYNGLSHEVEGIFEANGRNITLRKVYSEQWTKKRGQATPTFSGHANDFFIDGVPVKKKEYEDRIAGIANETIFKLLTSPTYFNEVLPWQKRRELLLTVCGDITDQDVIASNESLTKLPSIVPEGRTIDEHKKVIKAQQTDINKELERIPVRIDEATKSLPDLAGIDPSEVTGKIAVLKNRVKDKNDEIARIQGGGEVAEKTKTLREAEGRILDISNQHRAAADKKAQGKRVELNKAKDAVSDLQRAIKDTQRTIDGNYNLICAAEAKKAKLKEEWYRVNGEQFVFAQETVCPTCGQALPEDKLNAAREKALATFNRQKAQRLEDINNEGKSHAEEIKRLRTENEALEIKVSALECDNDAARIHEEALLEEMKALAKENGSLDENPEYIQALKEKERLEAEIRNLASGNAGQVTGIKAEITVLENEIAEAEKSLARIEQSQKTQERIADLKRQEKELAAEYERLAKELYLTEEFDRAKVAMLDERINSRFKYARFKLFETQINGGLAECCETLYKGIPYNSNLNKAARINVGIDIINTLAVHYGFTAPIWIDNAESVTELIGSDAQVIRLVVSKPDKKLRVEHVTNTQNDMREAV